MASLMTSMVPKYFGTGSEMLIEFMTSVCKLIPELRPHVCSKMEQLLDDNKHPSSNALR